MKKCLILALMSVGMIIGIVACSENQKNVATQEPTQDESLILLKDALASYNLTITPQSATTRGPGFWKIIKADASGAISGAKWGWWGMLGGAALFSVCEYFINKKAIAVEAMQIDVIPEDIGLPDDCVEILTGRLHNEIINNIFIKYPDIENMDIDQIMEAVFDETTLVSGVSDLGLRNELAFTTEMNAVKAVVKEGKYISNEVHTLFPEVAIEVEIIDMYCQTISGLTAENEINDYTTGFINIIKSSDINDEIKADLVSGVVTGLNSSNLWELQ